MTTNDAIDMLRRIVKEAEAGQGDILAGLERIDAMPLPRQNEVAADVVAHSESKFCKLSVRFTRILRDAKSAIPDFGPDLQDEDLDDPDKPVWPEE